MSGSSVGRGAFFSPIRSLLRMSVNADVAAEATLRLPAEPSDQRPRGALARFLLRQAMRAAGREVGPHLRGRDPIRVRSLEHDEPGGRGGKSHTLFFIR